ncbi:MAG TPA: DUF2892 domain-containing protein [Pirellulales bacterium]
MNSKTERDGMSGGMHPDIAAPGSLPPPNVNVGELERAASAVVGAALVAAGLRRGWLSGTVLALAGGALVYRGISGRCMLYESLGISTAGCAASQAVCRVRDQVAREGRAALDDDDAVEQASFDSFPASDPPSWSSTGH